MEVKEKKASAKSKQSPVTIILYVAAVVVVVLGVALLINNVTLYRRTVTQYVAQGYKAATVNKQLVPAQLLPAIFQSIALYGGLAVALFGAGVINEKLTKCLPVLIKEEVCNEVTKEGTSEKLISNVENTKDNENKEEVKPEEVIE